MSRAGMHDSEPVIGSGGAVTEGGAWGVRGETTAAGRDVGHSTDSGTR